MPPPRLAVALLERLLRGRQSEALLGDLLEEYRDRAARPNSAALARRWFWRETIAALATARVPRTGRTHMPAAAPTGDSGLSRFIADLRHGARVLLRAPLFTAMCIVTLALGIGASSAMVSVVYPVLIRPLAFPDPGRLVMIWERSAEGEPTTTSFATISDIRRTTRSLSGAAAIGYWTATIAEGGDPERLPGQRVSASFFGVLGIRPALGRDFRPEEDAPGANRVVMLSHGLWQRRFGSDPNVIGRAIPLDGVPHEVVGVLPADFDNVLNPDAQIWRVLGYDAAQPWACRTCRHLRMIARIHEDVTLEAAAAELSALSEALVGEHPREYPAAGVHVVRLQDEVTRAARPVLLVLLGAVALVLLLAVANVANLQLARALARAREFAIRAALGAGRARIVQQLLAEGLLLAAIGGATGVAVAWLALPLLLVRLPADIPRLGYVRIDGAVLVVAATLTLVLGIAVGLLPALRSSRGAVFGSLRGGDRIGGGHRLARAGLVSVQVALALVLLAGAGLLARTLSELFARDPGFDPRGLLVLEVQATGPAYADAAVVYDNHDLLRERVAAIPGVASAALTNQLPLGGGFDRYGVRALDKPLDNPALAPSADRYVVTPEFMRTMRITLRAGRGFTPADADSAASPVAIVSAALAARIWPGEMAVGKRVQVGAPTAPWREVIGVAADIRHSGLDSEVGHQLYVPERQWPWADAIVTLIVRAHGDA
ncbi:MAG TPA: ADOP family duplicated permease, partial [Gemmatimonadaceae bacterium]|nr:ADOP family duplicated permease [Gemmatimonadaceae bacterium]